MVTSLVAILAFQLPAANFETRTQQLNSDRIEAFHLCEKVLGEFGFQYSVSLGNSNLSRAYFPAGRADRMFVSNFDGNTKKTCDGYEIREGRARRVWRVNGELSAKGGKLQISSRSRVNAAQREDLARTWALASFTSENMGGQSFTVFQDDKGRKSTLEMCVGNGYPVMSSERSWLKSHGFPVAITVRESAMKPWKDRADQLRQQRTRFAAACNRLLPVRAVNYVFPLGRADRVFIFGPPNSKKTYEGFAFDRGNGTPKLRWRVRLRESDQYPRPGHLVVFLPVGSVPAAAKVDLTKTWATADYQAVEQATLAIVTDDLGHYHGQEQISIGSYETLDSEIYYLRANRPWAKSGATSSRRP